MLCTKNYVMLTLILSLTTMACSSKSRNKSETPPPLPTEPIVVPLITPTSTPVPYRGSLNSEFGRSFVEEDELAPLDKYDPKSPENLNRGDGPIKRFTGFKDSEGNAYTDAANDLLITFLRKHQQFSDTKKNAWASNLKFVESIRDVKIQHLTYGRVSITLKLLTPVIDTTRNKSTTTIRVDDKTNDTEINITKTASLKKVTTELTLSGTISNRFARLKVSGSAAKTETIAGGEFRCLDLDETSCETSFIRLTTKTGALAEVVLRRTIADLHVDFNEKQNHLSNNFKLLQRLFYNTQYRTEFYQPIIEKTVFNSFAVVNGRSAVSIKLIMDKSEALLFKAPLISSSYSNNDINVVMNQNIKTGDLTEEELRKNKNEAGISYREMFEEAKLTKNNGLGQLQITLALKQESALAGNEEPILFKIYRIVKPIVALDEDSIFFE